MKLLNLSTGFRPFQGGEIPFTSLVFNGGEPHIKIQATLKDMPDSILITTRISNSDDLVKLILAVNAIRGITLGKPVRIGLFLPYFPGARQDRIVVPGEPLTAKVYADLINSLNFNQVTILDPHSIVTPALINNCYVITNESFAIKALLEIRMRCQKPMMYLVAPDLGAKKKTEQVAKLYPHSYDILQANKKRNLDTGQILSIELLNEPDEIGNTPCVIVDDICDGGGTFIGVAEALRKKGATSIYLVVTHGIFSKGFKELNKHFDGIYTTDSFPNIDNDYFCIENDKQYNKVTQFKLADVL